VPDKVSSQTPVSTPPVASVDTNLDSEQATWRARWKASRVRELIRNHFRLFELVGIAVIATAAFLEVTSIREADRLRSSFQQRVYTQVLLDEITYRAFHATEHRLLLQSPSNIPLIETIIGNHRTQPERGEEMAQRSLDVFDVLLFRSEGLHKMIFSYRKKAKLEPSAKLASEQEKLKRIAQTSKEIRKSLCIDKEGNFILPFGKLYSLESSTDGIRTEALDLTAEAISEVEDRRSRNAYFHMVYFSIGSILLILGKFGNWIYDRDRDSTKVGENQYAIDIASIR
jgi:hypothetical protein